MQAAALPAGARSGFCRRIAGRAGNTAYPDGRGDMETTCWAAGLDIFSRLGGADIDWIDATFLRRDFGKSQVIMSGPEALHYAWFVVAGAIRVTSVAGGKLDPRGVVIGAGEFFVDVSLFGARPFFMRVVSLEKCVCRCQCRDDFFRLIRKYPHLKDFFYATAIRTMERGLQALFPIRREAAGQARNLPRGIQKSLDYIARHYCEALSLDQVARVGGMSKFRFSRAFNQYTGWSFKDYLNRKRVMVARRLLARADLTVAEVGCRVGYRDMSYFARVFKKIEGMSPSAFRKKT